MATGSLTERVDLTRPTRSRRGILANAEPIEGGVEHDIAVAFSGCVEPILRDKCITNVDDEASRPEVATFKVFPIESASECSTLSGLDHRKMAADSLGATTEWAMGRQLAEDVVGNGSPTLTDTPMGTVAGADFVHAVSCLEQAAADTGFGTDFVLHAPYRAAAYLKRLKLMDKNGLSPTGHKWIISPGYPVEDDTTVRIWLTGVVWAAADETPQINDAVQRRQNTDTAYALGAGLVAFDPCLNIAIDVTVPACP